MAINSETNTVSRTEYDALLAENAKKDEQIAKLTQQVNWLLEQLRLSKKKIFGSSSERAGEEVMDQLSLFNEAETIADKADAEEKEDETINVPAHTRKTPSAHVLDTLPENIPVEVVEHRTPEEDRLCSECGTLMIEIGKEKHRSLVIIPAQVKIREDWYYTYACPKCKKEGIEVPIVKTEKAPSVMPGSYASPEAIAYIAVQKFMMYVPLYRQEMEWNNQKIMLSRQTMSNWLLFAADNWFKPIYDVEHRKIVKREVLHGDETTVQVLKEPGKTAQSKSYIWLFRTSGDAKHPIVLYEYQPSRETKHAEKFLEGFSGYLHADGYSGYHSLPERITIVGCWAHVRRKFNDALSAVPKKQREDSLAARGVAYCSRLFDIERQMADLPPEKRYELRLEREKPVLDELLSWAKEKSTKVPPKSAIGKALYYLQEQWPYLLNYLKDGRLELSNNRAERSIKPFVMGRKNFLFANTPRGAQSSAIIYSLIETAKENGLDPYRYLVYVLTKAPALSREDPDWAEKLTPEHVPEECRVN